MGKRVKSGTDGSQTMGRLRELAANSVSLSDFFLMSAGAALQVAADVHMIRISLQQTLLFVGACGGGGSVKKIS